MFPDFRCFKSSRKTTSCRLFRPHVSGRGGILLYTFYIVLQQALQRRVELQFFDHCLSMFYRSLPWFHAHQPAFYWILNLKFNRLSSFKRPWSKQWQQTIATAKGQQSGLAFPYMDATWCDAKNCRVQPPKEQDLKTHDLQRSSTLGLGLPNNGYQHCCFPHSQILQTHPILADLWWYYLVEDYFPHSIPAHKAPNFPLTQGFRTIFCGCFMIFGYCCWTWACLDSVLTYPTHPRVEWPSCFQLPSGRRRSCPDGRAGRTARRGRCPWYLELTEKPMGCW